MAKIGACYPCFKPEGSQTGVVLGKLVSANLTINNVSGELAADDTVVEKLTEFASGNIAMETDDILDEVAAKVYGCKVEEGLVTYNINDTPPRGHLGYYKMLLRNGQKAYQGYFYPRVQASIGNDNAQTKGTNITFASTSTTFTVFADDNGDWRKTKLCASPKEAKAWLNTMCSIPTTEEDSAPESGGSAANGGDAGQETGA